MSRILTNGAAFYIETSPPATPTPLVPTAITQASPPVVTVAATTGMTKGDPIHFKDTGFPELDGKTFVTGTVTATTFEVAGADTTGSVGMLGANPEVIAVHAAAMTRLCIEAVTLGEASVADIDLSDFCNPTLTMPGKVTLGAITFHGWVDDAQKGTINVFRAAAADNKPRYFEILSKDGKVALVGQISIGSVSWGIVRDSGFEFNIAGTQAEKVDLLFI